MTKGRNWCFTLNNPTTAECSGLRTSPQVKFLLGVLECGETTATVHYQGYLELLNPRAITFLKGLCNRAHWEKRQGTRKQALLYVMKTLDTDRMSQSLVCTAYDAVYHSNISTAGLQDSAFPRIQAKGFEGTFGELLEELNGTPKTSLTERLLEIQTRIQNGATEEDISNDHFPEWCKYRHAFKAYKLIQSKPRDFKTKVIVVQGPTGTGKSRWCHETFPGAYWKSRDQWWDGYEQQDTVVFDEFYGWISYDCLLRLCDRYPMDVEVKGGKTPFIARTIVFTTNRLPNKWYDERKVYFKAFIRRVEEWWVFGSVFRSKYTDYKAVKFIEVEDDDKTGDVDNDYNRLNI